MYLYKCWLIFVYADGWKHAARGIEGEGVGPSGWANGNVASADKFYFLI